MKIKTEDEAFSVDENYLERWSKASEISNSVDTNQKSFYLPVTSSLINWQLSGNTQRMRNLLQEGDETARRFKFQKKVYNLSLSSAIFARTFRYWLETGFCSVVRSRGKGDKCKNVNVEPPLIRCLLQVARQAEKILMRIQVGTKFSSSSWQTSRYLDDLGSLHHGGWACTAQRAINQRDWYNVWWFQDCFVHEFDWRSLVRRFFDLLDLCITETLDSGQLLARNHLQTEREQNGSNTNSL